jgi:indolepyruvate ferredoxin oxidoreductase beta subunit
MTDERGPINILISAIGGQGGGVLTEWIVNAAAHAGHPAQATSIPGVAQRTGSTTYYIEVFPVPERDLNGRQPVFSLYPAAGDVDAIIAPEYLEAGRMVEQGYASPNRTTLICSTHRIYAIHEKMAVGEGTYPRENLDRACRELTKAFIGFDALKMARQHQTEVNALMLGALAASGVLPLPGEAFEAAIREGGVAVERNLKGFKLGYEKVRAGIHAEEKKRAGVARWDDLKAERAAALGEKAGEAFRALVARAEAAYPAPLQRVLGDAIYRLIDYQGPAYAEQFLAGLQPIFALDRQQGGEPRGFALTGAFARHLAVWMTYEDAIRVADLKTRRGRFARIRQEMGARPGQTVVVTDYLKPDLDEIYGILPRVIADPFARWAERKWPNGRPTIEQHVHTTSILGFLRVWTLGRLRFLRPHSHRYHLEHVVIAKWSAQVEASARLSYELGCAVAQAAQVVKGYGEVRRRTLRSFHRLLDEVLAPMAELDRQNGQRYELSRQVLERGLRLILADPKGIEPAVALAREILGQAPTTDYAALLQRAASA